ncbi:hypothetical protein [Rubritalea sp.]|uniref:hypothetical protein n=1 Tax=Rubritalea sp. TaxID=2109375 RepID=UPI003EF44F9E
MKALSLYLHLTLSTLVLAEDNSGLLEMHLQRFETGPIENISEWPNQLFNGYKKKVSSEIKTASVHDKFVSLIPNKLLKDYRLGTTVTHKGWFFTPVEPKNSDSKQNSWILLIASRKGDDYLYFNSVW